MVHDLIILSYKRFSQYVSIKKDVLTVEKWNTLLFPIKLGKNFLSGIGKLVLLKDEKFDENFFSL